MKPAASAALWLKTRRAWLLLCLSLCACAATAQEFSFKDTQGKLRRLADYRGKWVLVNFRSSQCQPCEEETPELVALHNAHKDSDLVVIGITLDATPVARTRAALEEFVVRHRVSYPLVISSYTTAEEQVGTVETLPSSYLYDPAGKKVIFEQGMVNRADVETFLLLKNKSLQKKSGND